MKKLKHKKTILEHFEGVNKKNARVIFYILVIMIVFVYLGHQM